MYIIVYTFVAMKPEKRKRGRPRKTELYTPGKKPKKSYVYQGPMTDQLQFLLEQSKIVFMRNGMKIVTMDDIANELKMAKKTIYKYALNKEDLIVRSLAWHLEQDKAMLEGIAKNSKDAIEEMIQVISCVNEMLSQIHPSIHYDMEKYYPRAYKLMLEHKEIHIYGIMLQNLNRGKKEGLYRKDLNAEIIARMYALNSDKVFDAQTFPSTSFKFTDVYMEYVTYHMRGITTPKGFEAFELLLKRK